MTIQLTRTIEWLLLPPGILVLLLLVAIRQWYAFQKGSRRSKTPVLLWFLLVTFYTMSINTTADLLTSALERPDLYPPLSTQQIEASQAQAIIILGHGRYANAPEYNGEDTLNTGGLARARYGAKLHRQTGLPLLTAGGATSQEAVSEAAIMKRVLETEFNVPVKWVEEKSRNTYENALFSSLLLKREGIERALLVTHSQSITRALWAFQKTGTLEIIPAPTLFSKPSGHTNLLEWVPNPYALTKTAIALHEHIGIFWYRWRYGMDTVW
ncbi:MAG: YdcF family protein [Magnetococcales bacterium]|nr:YdcF family protein [Magnetococcales bacterium]